MRPHASSTGRQQQAYRTGLRGLSGAVAKCHLQRIFSALAAPIFAAIAVVNADKKLSLLHLLPLLLTCAPIASHSLPHPLFPLFYV